MAEEVTTQDTLLKLTEWFEDSQQATIDERALSERCRDYYDGKQLTAEEIRILTKVRKQPVVINNLIKPKVDTARGIEQEARSDPKAYPRTPKHEEEAQAATDALRYVCDETRFSAKRSEVFENLYIEGTGGAEVCVKPRATEQGTEYEVEIVHYPWDRLFWDWHARTRNFSDARFLGGVKWMDEADVLGEPKWRDTAQKAVENAYTAEKGAADTTDDVPRVRWTDAKRKRVRVVSIYWREAGVWHYAIHTGGGFLEGPSESAYLDEDGQPMCAFELQSAMVDRDGARYGEVKQYLDMQDEVNKRRSKALHLAISNQSIGERGAVEDLDTAKAEKAKPDGHIELNPGFKFEFRENTTEMAAQFQFLQEAKEAINLTGPNPATMGNEARQLSGRALIKLEEQSKKQLGPVYDGLRDWELRIYRQIWCRIRQYWTGPKWVRVTDDEKNLKWVGLNQPITFGEVAQQLQAQGQEVPAEFVGTPPDTEIGKRHEVAKLDVDILLEDAPDTVTIQGEQFDALANLFPAVPDPMKPAAFEFLVEASSLRGKKEFLEKLKGGGQDPQQQAAAQAQQAQQAQAAQAMMEAKLRETTAKASQSESEAVKTMAEAHLIASKATGAEMMVNAAQGMAEPGEMPMQQGAAGLSGEYDAPPA